MKSTGLSGNHGRAIGLVVAVILSAILCMAAIANADEPAGQPPAAQSPSVVPAAPAAAPSAEAPKIPKIRVLLAGFENDNVHNVRITLRDDFLEMIKSGAMDYVNLDTTRDFFAGNTKTELETNAAKLAERQGYDFVVWGGTSGLISDVIITVAKVPEPAAPKPAAAAVPAPNATSGETAKAPEPAAGAPAAPAPADPLEGYKKFQALGFPQHFQFHLDVKFANMHQMVAKALRGLIYFRMGRYEEAALWLESSLAEDTTDVFGLAVIRAFAGFAHMDQVLAGAVADEQEVKKATAHWAKAMDWIRRLTEPILWGAIKANAAYFYTALATRDAANHDEYARKALAAIADAKGVFTEKNYKDLFNALDALEKTLVKQPDK